MEPAPQGTAQQQGRQQQQPVYDIRNGGHYGKLWDPKMDRAMSRYAWTKALAQCQALAQRYAKHDPTISIHDRVGALIERRLTSSELRQLSAQGYAPVAELYTGTWANVNQGLQGTARDILTTYWQHVINHLESDNHDYKIHQLPLARIKKVMKADPEVKMISAEAPILFAKGCDIFITELTMRAWIHAEDNKRRTLQRSDIAAALSKSDMFDFLIDIVPREEATSHAKRSSQAAAPGPSTAPGQMPPSQHGVQAHMGPADYSSLGQHGIPQDQEYRPQPAMYPGAVQSDPTAAYGQPQSQMFEGMYAYPHLPPQQ